MPEPIPVSSKAKCFEVHLGDPNASCRLCPRRPTVRVDFPAPRPHIPPCDSKNIHSSEPSVMKQGVGDIFTITVRKDVQEPREASLFLSQCRQLPPRLTSSPGNCCQCELLRPIPPEIQLFKSDCQRDFPSPVYAPLPSTRRASPSLTAARTRPTEKRSVHCAASLDPCEKPSLFLALVLVL